MINLRWGWSCKTLDYNIFDVQCQCCWNSFLQNLHLEVMALLRWGKDCGYNSKTKKYTNCTEVNGKIPKLKSKVKTALSQKDIFSVANVTTSNVRSGARYKYCFF